MKYNRKTFLDSLNVVAEGLSNSELLPVMQDFCFSEGRVMALNESISMVTDLKVEVDGCLHGNTLLKILGASRAKQIDIDRDGEWTTKIKAGAAKLSLAMKPVSSFPYSEPPEKGSLSLNLPGSAVDAIRFLDLSMGSDTANPEQLGITCHIKDNRLTMYSTNNKTMTEVKCKITGVDSEGGTRIIVPHKFWDVLLPRVKDKNVVKLALVKSNVVYRDQHGLIIGNLIEDDKPYDFAKVIKDHVTPELLDSCALIPPRLPGAIDRAIIVAGDTIEAFTQLTVKDYRATLITKTELGRIEDQMTLERHRDMTVKFDPRLLKKVCGMYDRIGFSSRCILAQDERGASFLMSPRG